MAVALQGSAGFEWDITRCTEEELEAVTAFAGLYKELRHLLHTGTVVRPDVLDTALRVRGVISANREEAVFTIVTVASIEEALTERLRLDGLDPQRRYTLRLRDEIGSAEWGWVTPAWMSKLPLVVSGRVLTEVGLQLPTLWPVQALVLHLSSVQG